MPETAGVNSGGPHGTMTEPEWAQLTRRISDLLSRLEELPEGPLRSDIFELLEAVDLLHREALSRMVSALSAAELARLTSDSIARDVLSLYDLAQPHQRQDRFVSAGANLIPLLAVDTPPTADPALDRTQPEACADGRLKRPRFLRVLDACALSDGALCAVEVEGLRLLLCRLQSEVFAFVNACPGSILPLDLGRLDGTTIVCPWHECRFDARSGRRLSGVGEHLQTLPVRIEAGMIQLALAGDLFQARSTRV